MILGLNILDIVNNLYVMVCDLSELGIIKVSE